MPEVSLPFAASILRFSDVHGHTDRIFWGESQAESLIPALSSPSRELCSWFTYVLHGLCGDLGPTSFIHLVDKYTV